MLRYTRNSCTRLTVSEKLVILFPPYHVIIRHCIFSYYAFFDWLPYYYKTITKQLLDKNQLCFLWHYQFVYTYITYRLLWGFITQAIKKNNFYIKKEKVYINYRLYQLQIPVHYSIVYQRYKVQQRFFCAQSHRFQFFVCSPPEIIILYTFFSVQLYTRLAIN